MHVPTTAAELARLLDENQAGPRRCFIPVGGRTALHYGQPVRAEAEQVSLAEIKRVVDYPARDMTVTVDAGLRVSELQELLATEGQRLPIDVPLANRATIGGIVATNTSGPGRFGHGTLRDYVIGISAVDASGRLFSAGGRVVKNVAGYDICKLLVGSLGTLAVITRVTFKLRPMAESRVAVWCPLETFDQVDHALAALMTSATRPIAIEVLNPKAARQLQAEGRQTLPADQPVLCVVFEGSAKETAWQVETLTSELRPFRPHELLPLSGAACDRLWASLIEYQAASDDPLTFQASLPPSRTMEFMSRANAAGVAAQAHAASGIVIGHLPDRCTTAELAATILDPLRALTDQHQGSLIVLNCEESWKSQIPVFGLPRGAWSLMHRLKNQLDPHGLLNPGRLPF